MLLWCNRLTFPSPVLLSVLFPEPELLPGAWVLTSLLPDVVLLSPEELLPEGLPPATPGP